MKYRLRFSALVGIFCLALTLPARAVEKDGLRVDVQQTVLDRNDGRPSIWREINRTMALKLKVTNNGFADLPEGKVKYTVLIQRWGSETGNVARYSGEAEIPAMLRRKAAELVLGEFTIGGHLHGTSRMHVDDLAGWKLEFSIGEKKVVISSSSSFDRMDGRATDASQ